MTEYNQLKVVGLFQLLYNRDHPVYKAYGELRDKMQVTTKCNEYNLFYERVRTDELEGMGDESGMGPLRPWLNEKYLLHGTGIAPGGISEKFPLMLSAMSTGVTFVRAEEFSDLRTYEAPDVLRYVMGFGDTPEKALTGPMQKLLDGGFIQSVRMIVDKIGFAADPMVRSSQEVAVATAPIDSPMGVIEPGQVAARKFHWEALVGDDVVVRVTVNWLMGEQDLDPAWDFGPEGQRYEMEVRGDPSFTVSVKGFQSEFGDEGPESGIVATAAHCVNSVPAVCAAAPGIATYLDLPLLGGRAAPRLG